LPELPNFVRAFDGPATRELRQAPGPDGAGRLPERLLPDGFARSVCGWCSTGCGLLVHLKDGEALNVSPDPHHHVNHGSACPKGWEALAPALAKDRGTTPLLRDPSTGAMEPVSWERALEVLVEKLSESLGRLGPEGAAFLSTGQIPTEEMLFLGALWKFGIGAAAADSNTRQCMATAHVAYKQSFGFDAPPFAYEDFEESDHLVFWGANPAIAHPILWERVMRNGRDPVVAVVDPRRTETAEFAHLHVALAPKSDLTLLHALAGEILRRGWVDRDYVARSTEGFEEFEAHVAGIDLGKALAEAGIGAERFSALADLFRPGKRTSVWWTMGVNQSHQAVRTAQAIVNLCLMTGNVGKPGTGPNSITGQMNAMGSRMFSCTSSLPGGRDWKDPDHRRAVAEHFGIDPDALPAGPGPAYDQILSAAADGGLGFLWVVATNPAHSWIGQEDFLRAADRAFLVVQDPYPDTETARIADLYLPSGIWGEKDGSQINSERRLSSTRRVRRPPGQARSDLDIFRMVAAAWGVGGRIGSWKSARDVFESMRELSRGRPCDFTGIPSLDALDGSGGVQWPCPEGTYPPAPQRRLFEDGTFFTPNGRAKFLFDPSVESPNPVSAEFPLKLLTGRGSSSQWHTLTRSNRSATLRSLAPTEPWVEIHPTDADQRGLAKGDWVRVRAAGGTTRARAVPSPGMRPGEVFLPMHFPEVNRLVKPVFDPHSRQPSYKDGAVQVEKEV